jgi:hypothetical protein
VDISQKRLECVCGRMCMWYVSEDGVEQLKRYPSLCRSVDLSKKNFLVSEVRMSYHWDIHIKSRERTVVHVFLADDGVI